MVFALSAPAEPSPVTLTEADCLAHALGESSIARIIEARTASHEAEAVRAETWRNPEIGYNREQLFGDARVGEDAVFLQQEFRISGAAGLRARAARELGRSEELLGRTQRSAHAATVRDEFYGLLAMQERLGVYEELLELMGGVEGELERRVSAGESAPYELHRLRKEIADIQAESAVAQADLAARQLRLARLVHVPPERAPDIRVQGSLMPSSVPNDTALADLVGQRPDVVAAASRVKAADMLERAAARAWLPDPQIQAGYRGVTDSGVRAHGFIVGLTFSLPILATGKADRLAAEAMRLEAEGTREYLMTIETANALGLAGRIRALSAAADSYQKEGVELASKVVETARLAYAAGELGILELIDGYRGLVEARLTMVDLAARARQDEIQLWQSLVVPGADGTEETKR